MSETPSPSSQPADSSFEVIAAGSFPFLCFYEISRDSPNRSVGSLAVSVAKSLYGAVRSLAGWGWSQAETEKRETIPRPKPVRTSFELADHKREGVRIWASPSGRFVAVSDGLNRVELADVAAGEVLKMWKGWKPGVSLRNRYRNVECFWSSMEVSAKGAPKKVPILGIFISFVKTAGMEFLMEERKSELFGGVSRSRGYSCGQSALGGSVETPKIRPIL